LRDRILHPWSKNLPATAQLSKLRNNSVLHISIESTRKLFYQEIDFTYLHIFSFENFKQSLTNEMVHY